MNNTYPFIERNFVPGRHYDVVADESSESISVAAEIQRLKSAGQAALKRIEFVPQWPAQRVGVLENGRPCAFPKPTGENPQADLFGYYQLLNNHK
jgi:hypothetical protein